jgi:hypothetical protein
MANTFVALATVTVGSGGAAEIEFASIAGSYTDLMLVASLRTNRTTSTGSYVKFTLNSSTSNFTTRLLLGNGSTATSDTLARVAGVENNAGSTANTFSNFSVYIPNYAGSSNKSYSVDGVVENNATEAFTLLSAGLWSDVSAITNIKLIPEPSGSYVQYSSATLYGIKNS